MDRNPSTIRRSTSGGSGSGGIILEKYQLGQILGRGSFAKVYRAQSLVDNSSVAIKVIEKPAISDPTLENLLIREVGAMRRLNNHPNILNLHEVMATKSKIYLVMELAEGGELFTQLTRRGRMTETVARRYFQQLISALRFCHSNGVTHRDLKPQNLLLDQFGTLKVSDFGLSALPEQVKNGLLHTACGTPAYTAPEVVRRNGYDGTKADAFSCGVILFVFLAGYLPYEDGNLGNMYKKICKREFVFPDWISKPARNVIFKLLDPNPNTRMTMEALINTSWFKKSLKVETDVDKLGDLLGKDCKGDACVNAFDLISMSSGLDLSGLFEAELGKKEKRFTSRGSMKDIEERVERVCGELGYKFEKGKGSDMGLIKGKIVLLIRILELVTKMGLLMVEMKVVSGGDELDKGVDGDQLEALKLGLSDIAVSWHNNDVVVNA